MPSLIDPETLHVDELPGVWSPVQWVQTREEHAAEVENQATASLLTTVDIPEAILRLLLAETEIYHCPEPPKGYNPEVQGEWDESLITFAYNRTIRLESVERQPDRLVAIYRVADLGLWQFTIQPEKVVIERI